MHKNPHFRVLALTATPGSKPDDVQELCDALHISRIEIRDEFSSDLKQYIFDKVPSSPSPVSEHAVDPCALRYAGNRAAYRGNERRDPADSFTPFGADGGTKFTNRIEIDVQPAVH